MIIIIIIICDFEIETDHVISARRPGLAIAKKKKEKRKKEKENLPNSVLSCPGIQPTKIKR